jgi:hypothetical protein
MLKVLQPLSRYLYPLLVREAAEVLFELLAFVKEEFAVANCAMKNVGHAVSSMCPAHLPRHSRCHSQQNTFPPHLGTLLTRGRPLRALPVQRDCLRPETFAKLSRLARKRDAHCF